MNKALQEITSILKAMGANPAPVSDTEIKINAPRADRERIANNEKTKD